MLRCPKYLLQINYKGEFVKVNAEKLQKYILQGICKKVYPDKIELYLPFFFGNGDETLLFLHAVMLLKTMLPSTLAPQNTGSIVFGAPHPVHSRDEEP